MLIFILIIVFLVVYILSIFLGNKLSIKFRTFFYKGAKGDTGQFGVYCFCGAQGRGKTYSLVEFIHDNSNLYVFSNVKFSENINKYNRNNIIRYYSSGFSSLLELKELLDKNYFKDIQGRQIVIVYDELFQELSRGDKLSKGVLDFLSQMRKRQIIFLTSAQYWSEIPITFRRFVRFQIDCNLVNFFFLPFSVLFKTFYDGDTIKWDEELQDFHGDLITTSLTKVRRNVFKSYDTFQIIKLSKN